LAWYVTRPAETEKLAIKIKLTPDSLNNVVQRLAPDAQVQLLWILYDLDNPNK
jgi:hypothetical protein